MVSIREVAKIAGVSPATVSRVINNTANVDMEKKRRVEEAIKETGFVPNELARALYKRSSKLIGVILPDIENPFFSELAKAVEEEAYLNGYRILFCNSNDDPQKEVLNIKMISQLKSDGIIIMSNCDSTNKVLADCKVPVVLLDRTMKEAGEIALIQSDHYKGGCLATEHLIKRGCKNIVFLRGPVKYSSGQLRYQGYQDICKKYEMKEQFLDCPYDYESGVRIAEEALKKYPQLDGIIACNDIVAISAYKVLHKEGKKVPEDVQLIGFDDILAGRLLTPELTTVHQPIKEMGALAARIIIDNVEGKSFSENNVFDVNLIQRETTK